jgi:DNA-binding winged helix-turn-helix (wHTH) protein
VEETVRAARLVRFGAFEVDLRAGELRKDGVKLKLTGQPFQVLTILLEQPGEVATREELQKRLWPDTFVDVDHNLNTAINKIREVLGDSAEIPRFVETLPRRGYRFIALLDNDSNGGNPGAITIADTVRAPRRRVLRASLLLGTLTLLSGAGFLFYKGGHAPASPRQRTLTRVTFDDGLQIGATWSPDGRFIAYSSDHGGKLDIWMQQVSGDPIQITEGPGNKWAPNWSPDGIHRVPLGKWQRRVVHCASSWWYQMGAKDSIVWLLSSLVSRRLPNLVPNNRVCLPEPESVLRSRNQRRRTT